MLTPKQQAKTVASIGKLLSSETRCAILSTLHEQGAVCVKDLAAHIGASHSAVSHQLAQLEQAGMVRGVRSGKTVCYRLSDTDVARRAMRGMWIFLSC